MENQENAEPYNALQYNFTLSRYIKEYIKTY